MGYKFKLILTSLIFMLSFNGCFDEEKPKKIKSKKTVTKLISKVVEKKDDTKPLSQEIEEDGIVVDGARDEELLDAFGLAVSQAIVEDGVSVPDCAALEKTGYLTKDECEEISTKYFGFYEIQENGDASKVGDVFKDGIAGGEISIQEGLDNFFDSSGNPLLDNQVEFEDVVSKSEDLDFLNKLKAKIPKEKKELLDNINAKIALVEDSQAQASIQEAIEKEVEKENKNEVSGESDSGINDFNEEEEIDRETLERDLANLQRKHQQTSKDLKNDPNNETLINKFNNEEIEIAILKDKLGY